MKMDMKKLLVSFFAIASVLLLVATVSAADYNIDSVKIDGLDVLSGDVSVVAGETVTLKVAFTSNVNDSDVTVEAEIEGEKVDVEAITSSFDVESGKMYRKVLTLKVPYELKDQLSDDLILNIEIDGKDSNEKLDDINLRVQRETYNADIKSISVDNMIEAGETFPVDIVLKNIGYNDLDDLFVKVSIPALGVVKTAYFGDIVAIECDDDDMDSDDRIDTYGVDVDRNCNEDDEDTVYGRLYLKVPYEVSAGSYALEVEVTNDDTVSSEVVQLNVMNDLSETVIKSGNDLILINPTDKVKVYTIIVESPASASESVVVVPAGSSKTVTVVPNAEGSYNFNVNVLSGSELVSTIAFSGEVADEAASLNNPIVVLTVILAIVFLVLLVVLIVLIGKKPEKAEEFGESYY